MQQNRYYPTKQELQLFQSENQKELKQQYSLLKEMPIQFALGTSQQYGMDAEFREMMREMEERYRNTGEEMFYHLSSRMKSVASLDDELYEEFCDNKTHFTIVPSKTLNLTSSIKKK